MRRPLLTAACAALLGLSPHAAAAPPSVGPSQGTVTAPPALAPSLTGRFGPQVRVRYAADGRTPRQVHGLSEATSGPVDPGARAAAFLAAHGDVFHLSGSFEVVEVQSPRLRGAAGVLVRHIVRLRTLLAGIPVEGRAVTVTLDADLRVLAVTADAGLLRPPATSAPTLDAAAAAARVEARYNVRALPANATKVLLPAGPGGATRLAWKVPTAAIPLVAHFFVWIDARDGSVLKTAPAGPDQGLAQIPERRAEEGP